MKHTLSVLVEDESGVLTRIAGLFARRGFNIESLAVGPAEEVGISRITMVVPSDERTIEQLTKQLYKLVNILKVEDITNLPCIEREWCSKLQLWKTDDCSTIGDCRYLPHEGASNQYQRQVFLGCTE